MLTNGSVFNTAVKTNSEIKISINSAKICDKRTQAWWMCKKFSSSRFLWPQITLKMSSFTKNTINPVAFSVRCTSALIHCLLSTDRTSSGGRKWLCEFISPKTALSVLLWVLSTLAGRKSHCFSGSFSLRRRRVDGGDFSSGTCACGTAPLGAPGTAESWPAGGRGAPGGRWRSLAPAGLASACGPESPSAPGTPADKQDI